MKALKETAKKNEGEEMILQRRRQQKQQQQQQQQQRFYDHDHNDNDNDNDSDDTTGKGTIATTRRQRQRRRLWSTSSSSSSSSSTVFNNHNNHNNHTHRSINILAAVVLIASMIHVCSNIHQLQVLQVVTAFAPTTTDARGGRCPRARAAIGDRNSIIIQSRRQVICDSKRRTGHRVVSALYSSSSSSLSSSSSDNGDDEDMNNSDDSEEEQTSSFRKRVKGLAKRIVSRPFSLATTVPDPSAIGAVLKDASYAAVEEMEKEIRGSGSSSSNGNGNKDSIIQSIVDDAFAPMEASLKDMEQSLQTAGMALDQAKLQSYQAIEALQLAAMEQQVEINQNQNQVSAATIDSTDSDSDSTADLQLVDLSALTFEDIDYESSEMAPPFLDPDSCLMTDAEPIVRVEKAPDNSRRIFAGIDILASADDVWDVLTNYAELQNVIPNLVVNDVLDLYDAEDGAATDADADTAAANDGDGDAEEVKCKRLSQKMKGSLLRQVGGAKVAGINFSAKTTVEVREWPTGMPDFAHFMDDMWEGKSRETRAKEYPKIKLKRYRFPRPFAVSNLPTRDISMQSIANDDGEFRLYQGVWRMQPLVGCSPPGKKAMRLTYAVEISPRVYLPVRLVEGRIVQDLCANLEAIRNAVSSKE